MTGTLIVGAIFAVVFGRWAFSVYEERQALKRHRWAGTTPHAVPVVFLNGGMAIRPTVLGHQVPEGYRQACRFFGVGLIDRTGTLDPGFEPKVFDPIPDDISCDASMAELCRQRAVSIVEESRRIDMPIRLLWSGGIDSTCVAVTLLEALGEDTERLEVTYSKASLGEYHKFYRLLRKRDIRTSKIQRLAEGLDPDALIVTGEHGDQIFGSMLAADLSPQDLKRPWGSVMPQHMESKIGAAPSRSVLAWMDPQITACPIALESTYDFLWWANFSMKWQTVSQRVLAVLDTTEERNAVSPLLRHFFRTDDFQRWALANPDQKIRDDWASYKYPLKDIIFAFNGDKRYRKTKIKERSLRGLTGRLASRAIAIDSNGQMHAEPIDRSILPAKERWLSKMSLDWE